MNALPFSLHHLGLAARRPESARKFARALGYSIGETVHDPLQSVDLAMCDHPAMPSLEIVTPGKEPGPLAAFLRTVSELVYHLCYEVDDIDRAAKTLAEGVGSLRCVSEAKPAVLFGGRPVAFYLVPGAGLVELLERAS